MVEQKFGGPWTNIKLRVLEQYFDFYTKALKNQNFKLLYIDAFAGSGRITVNDETTDGSPLIALRYNFHKFFFIESNEEYAHSLKSIINEHPKKNNIEINSGDCNEILKKIIENMGNYERGVIFLDPYAMDLHWETLEMIARTKKLDVWYLFPISALSRCMPVNGIPEPSWCAKIKKMLGTDDWQSCLYKESPQLNLFGDTAIERKDFEAVCQYVIRRLETIFPKVAQNSLRLKNTINSVMFYLFFAISNPNDKAIKLSLKGAEHILKNVDER